MTFSGPILCLKVQHDLLNPGVSFSGYFAQLQAPVFLSRLQTIITIFDRKHATTLKTLPSSSTLSAARPVECATDAGLYIEWLKAYDGGQTSKIPCQLQTVTLSCAGCLILTK